MKVWFRDRGCTNLNLEDKYCIGDIEIFSTGDVYEIIENADDVSPAKVCFSGRRRDLAFKIWGKEISAVANTKIAEKLYKDKIWKKNDEWILIKK